MITSSKEIVHSLLRASERWTKTDMVYLFSNGFWLGLNFFVSSLLGLFVSILFARLLSPNVYGTYQYILSLSVIIGAVTLTGFNAAVTKSVAQGYEYSYIKSIPTQLIWSLLGVLAALGIGSYYWLHGAETIGLAVFVVGGLLPISNTYNTYTAFLNGKKLFKALAITSILQALLQSVVIAICLFLGGSLMQLVVTYFCSIATTNILFHFITLRLYPVNDKIDEGMVTYGKHLSLMNVLNQIAVRADDIIVFTLLGAPELAVYYFAKIIPEKMKSFFRIVSTLALPKLASNIFRDEHSGLYIKTGVFLAAIAGSIVLYVAAAPLIFKLLFANYASSIIYSQIIVLSVLISAAGLPVNSLIARGKYKELYAFNTALPMLQIVITFLSISTAGLWGAVLSKIVNNLLYLVTALFFYKISLRKEITDVRIL